jgi:hypothetical protein
MPITFGSVGDIIAVCLIIKDLINALDDSRGSASAYQKVITDLRILERALLELDLLYRTCERTTEYIALAQTARQKALECRGLVVNFYDKIKKYNASLREGGSGNMLRDTYWKIHWHMTYNDCLESFRTEIQGRTNAVQLLFITAHL